MRSDRDLLIEWRAADAATIAAARAGDAAAKEVVAKSEAAGNELYERHYRDVHRFVVRLVYDTKEVEGVVQETFLTLRTGMAPFRGEDAAFRGFVLGIAKNKYYDYLRKCDRHNRLVDNRADPDRVAEVTPADLGLADPSGFVETTEEHKLLLKAMHRIAVDYQVALHLSFWHEQTNPQIAKILELPVGTVASRIRIGKERVHAKLDEFKDDPRLIQSTREVLRWHDKAVADAEALIAARLKKT